MLHKDTIISLGGIIVTRLMIPTRQSNSSAASADRIKAARVVPTLVMCGRQCIVYAVNSIKRNVMPGLGPGIHVFSAAPRSKTWMGGGTETPTTKKNKNL